MTTPQSTSDGRFPLEEFPITIAGREWHIKHVRMIFSRSDEKDYFERVGLPYGLALWLSSVALAHELASRSAELAGKAVLELGAGAGLPGLVAAHCGARVYQTDNLEAALWLSRLNAESNGISGIEYGLVDWNDFADDRQFDFIVGSDILYYAALQEPLLRIFQTALAPGGHVVLADPLRESSVAFFDRLTAAGWDIDVDFYDMKDDVAMKRAAVLDLKAPPTTAVLTD